MPGAKVWYFPDGYLPEKLDNTRLESHEALMLFNVNETPAHVHIDFYFDNRDPVLGVPVEVGAQRVISLRLDQAEAFGGPHISPLVQYALRVCSDIPIVAQFGRLDATQPNLAYYGTMGFWE
jgi:hypothetical protein